MEYIKKEDLKEGDIFVTQLSHNNFLNKYGTGFSLNLKTDNSIKNEKLHKGGGFAYDNIRLATAEEKHWLNSCIQINKFIEFDEAMKSFIPEFVLSEKWCILRTKENHEIINKWFKDKRYGNPWADYNYINISSDKNNYNASNTIKNDFQEITFEQFKKYVLKEEIIEEKVIESLPQFKVIETIETITKVENNEGNQFFIGDMIKSNSDHICTIVNFKYNLQKTQLLAISSINLKFNINEIEHYIEPKVEINNRIAVNIAKNSYYGLYPLTPEECDQSQESLLEKAKRLYPVGTEFYAARGNKGYYKVKNNSEFREMPDGAICIESNGNGTVYFNGIWGEIIK